MFKYVPKRVSQLDELKKMNKKGFCYPFYIDRILVMRLVMLSGMELKCLGWQYIL